MRKSSIPDMRSFIFILALLLCFNAKAQNIVQGKVYDNVGNLPGVKITEQGTDNTTTTSLDGQFKLTTLNDSSTLVIHYAGYFTPEVFVTSDTTLNISMGYDFYNTRWLSFGINHESVNSVSGFQISNGVDEEPLIHFEDFQDRFLIKAFGQSDFNGNYGYGIEAGTTYLRPVGRTTLNYSFLNYIDSDLILNDLNLTSRITYLKNIGLIFRAGYQKLNSQKNLGLGLGVERQIASIHINLNTRFYFDYFHHQVSFQFRPSKQKLFTFRAIYNRIDTKNLLSFGLNYAFVRTAKHSD